MMYLAIVLSLSSFCYCSGLILAYRRRYVFKSYEELIEEGKHSSEENTELEESETDQSDEETEQNKRTTDESEISEEESNNVTIETIKRAPLQKSSVASMSENVDDTESETDDQMPLLQRRARPVSEQYEEKHTIKFADVNAKPTRNIGRRLHIWKNIWTKMRKKRNNEDQELLKPKRKKRLTRKKKSFKIEERSTDVTDSGLMELSDEKEIIRRKIFETGKQDKTATEQLKVLDRARSKDIFCPQLFNNICIICFLLQLIYIINCSEF